MKAKFGAVVRNKRFWAGLVLAGAAAYGANLSADQADQLAQILAQFGAQLPV